MKFEAGKTYKTRSGEEAFIYCVDAPGLTPIHGRICDTPYAWAESGNSVAVCSHRHDLIAPEPERISQTFWVNVNTPNKHVIYTTKQWAEYYAGNDTLRIAVPCLLTEIVSPE